jgi:hypothetical protein
LRPSLVVCLALLLTGRSAAGAELADLRAARSLLAEAALVFRLEAQHRLAEPYVAETQKIIREQLQSELQNLDSNSQEGQLVRAGLAALEARDPARLDQTQQKLTHLVDRREQSD